MNAPVSLFRHQRRHLFINIHGAEYSGNRLGQIGRPGGSRNAHLKVDDKHKIQHYIQTGRQHQKKKGHLTVSHCPQVGGKQVVKYICHHAKADEADVAVGVGKNIFRRIHQMEQRFHKQNACCCKEYRTESRIPLDTLCFTPSVFFAP